MTERRALGNSIVATDLTIVIPTVGRIELLRNCLLSIASGSVLPQEVLLGDQSRGHTVANLVKGKSYPFNVRVVPSSRLGIACNMNQLFSEARTELLLVTHDDCRVDDHWVQCGLDALHANPGGLVTGKVLPGGGGTGTVPSTIILDEPEDLTNTRKAGRLYPANMGVYRQAVIELGGFDERAGFKLAAEDLDFAYRWLLDSRPMHYVPAMVVVHEDWREDTELNKLHRLYARAGGRFYGKHLYKGDRHVLRMALNDIKTGVRAWYKRLSFSPVSSTDPRLARPVWIPIGVIEGLYESWRLGRVRMSGRR